MRKILLSLAMAVAALPALATDYTDNLYVTVNQAPLPTMQTTITVNPNGDGTYNFELKNFKFNTLSLGNITLNNVASVSQDGVVYLYASENVPIQVLGRVPLTLRAELRDGESKLYASMDIYVQLLGQNVGVVFGRGYQLPNSGFEDYQDYTVPMVDFTTGGPVPTTVQEAQGWHSFASAQGDYKDAANAFSAAHTFKSSLRRPGSSGSSSLMIASTSVFGIPANGTITTGRMNCGAMTPDDPANHAEMDLSSDSLDAHGDPFYAAVNGQPDSLVVWYAFKQGTPTADHPYATVNAVLTDGTYYQDPEDKAYANKRSQARNAQIATTYTDGQPVWQKLEIPFTMIDRSVAGKGLLVTISTNADPGAGSLDTLYVDDISLVYNAPQNVSISWGEPAADGTISADAISATWDGSLGARLVKDLRQSGSDVVATVSVYSDDLSARVAEETHTYANATLATPTAIHSVEAPASASAAKAYDLQGRRVSTMRPGEVYILRSADGKTVKIAK